MSVRVLHGDCRAVLPTLPENSVQCVVTSPPYWGLRDYGIGPDSHGLEPTIDLFVAHEVAIFREVKRVLRDDGTLWLNLGDSYASTNCGGGSVFDNGRSDGRRSYEGDKVRGREATKSRRITDGLKPKDLCLIPSRVALALQADGWWLRSEIIWAKPNPMPESVRDRPTSAHEKIFLLTKSERYFYDQDAVREQGCDPRPFLEETRGDGSDALITGRASRQALGPSGFGATGSRNLRNVWTFATEPFSLAHFATFPTELVRRCVLAGTSEKGCCSTCGAPWVRQTEISYEPTDRTPAPNKGHLGAFGERAANMTRDGFVPNREKQTTTTGWSPSCACAAPTKPCVVLDPFGGSGTVGLVADRLQRNAILIEAKAEYVEMARRRITDDAPLLVSA